MRKLSDVILEQRPLVMNTATPVIEAARQMRERGAGSAVVVDEGGKLCGIFTGRDAVARVVAEGRDARTTPIAAVMTRNPATLSPDESAVDALRLMWDGGFRHLPLVRDGKILGVVSRGDFKGLELDRHDEERELWEHMR